VRIRSVSWPRPRLTLFSAALCCIWRTHLISASSSNQCIIPLHLHNSGVLRGGISGGTTSLRAAPRRSHTDDARFCAQIHTRRGSSRVRRDRREIRA
jgi:hypothetical protein